QPAHQLDRVDDVDLSRESRVVLAGAHVGHGRADEGRVIVRPFERREVGIAQVERQRFRAWPPRRALDPKAKRAAMRVKDGAYEAVASNDQCATVSPLLEVSSGHCRIY